jgi:hypothetical protein
MQTHLRTVGFVHLMQNSTKLLHLSTLPSQTQQHAVLQTCLSIRQSQIRQTDVASRAMADGVYTQHL